MLKISKDTFFGYSIFLEMLCIAPDICFVKKWLELQRKILGRPWNKTNNPWRN